LINAISLRFSLLDCLISRLKECGQYRQDFKESLCTLISADDYCGSPTKLEFVKISTSANSTSAKLPHMDIDEVAVAPAARHVFENTFIV
jgi:hypothetical protein